MKTRLRPAELRDVPILHAIADRFLLHHLQPEAIEQHGFLVSNFSFDAYQFFLERADYFEVLEDEEGIAAFILAYRSERIDARDEVDQAMLARYPNRPFVVIKQICVLPERSGYGYARRLYDHVREESGGLPQVAAVVLEPYNAPSVGFHRRLGFRELFRMPAADGMLRGVFGRGLDND